MKRLLLLLVLCALVVPAFANTVSYQAPDNKAVWGLDFDIQQGTSGTILLTLEDGSTVSGTYSYEGFVPLTADVSFGGDTSTYSYYIALPVPLSISIWNGDNSTYGREIKLGYGQNRGIWNDVLVTSISQSPTVGYTITSTDTITVTNELIDRTTASQRLAAGNPYDGSALDVFFEQFNTLTSIFFTAAWWLKFLFVDNLMLTVSLYVSGTMAYAILSTRNIFVFYKVWFRQQKEFFEFMVNMASAVVSIVAQIGGLAISGASSILGKLAAFFI